MSTKADLTELLAETSGSARHRKANSKERAAPVRAKQATTLRAGRGATSPITVHFPKQVRDQIKILAIEEDTTLHGLVAEAFNDMFAKYGKPEIVPVDATGPLLPGE
jgi:hypothetical protein